MKVLAICLLVAGCFWQGCAPVFSEMQSARMLKKGQTELTGHYSAVSLNAEGETEKVQNQVGLQLGTGVADNVNLRVRLERISSAIDEEFFDDLPSIYAVGFGPKLGNPGGNVAINLPVGFAFGEDVRTEKSWEFQPTLLFTVPVTPQFEINPSGKALIPIGNPDLDVLVAFNLGLGISSDLNRWALRPEVGYLFNPGEDGHYFHWSLGVSVATP